jgi:hypothetical protein
VVDAALSDGNLRVRREAIALAAKVEPARAVGLAAAAFADPSPRAAQDRPSWVTAITGDDAALTEYVRRKAPGGDELLLSIAGKRADPALAAAVAARLETWLDAPANAPRVAAAVIRQADRPLARRFFNLRDKLPANAAAYVPYALERAYGAGIGGVAEDWEAYLAKRP